MNEKHNSKLTKYSQQLRKEMTAEEKKLWYQFLKKLPFTVHRQKVIGNFIADFYCVKASLVIELDEHSILKWTGKRPIQNGMRISVRWGLPYYATPIDR